jgi:hypothetical protein
MMHHMYMSYYSRVVTFRRSNSFSSDNSKLSFDMTGINALWIRDRITIELCRIIIWYGRAPESLL